MIKKTRIRHLKNGIGGCYADKDTECKVVLNDDGTAKVKLIAGSLSKSYQFNVDDAEKALFTK